MKIDELSISTTKILAFFSSPYIVNELKVLLENFSFSVKGLQKGPSPSSKSTEI